jgi:hypothetical protein
MYKHPKLIHLNGFFDQYHRIYFVELWVFSGHVAMFKFGGDNLVKKKGVNFSAS